jgi:hypothetical protein
MKTDKQWITIYFVQRCGDKIVRLLPLIYLIEMYCLFAPYVENIFIKKRLKNNTINKALIISTRTISA